MSAVTPWNPLPDPRSDPSAIASSPRAPQPASSEARTGSWNGTVGECLIFRPTAPARGPAVFAVRPRLRALHPDGTIRLPLGRGLRSGSTVLVVDDDLKT